MLDKRLNQILSALLLLFFVGCDKGESTATSGSTSIESANETAVQDQPETEDEFLVVLDSFLHDCWWDKNFNSLLLNEDEHLQEYLDEKYDVQRLYSPGTVNFLGSREKNFGFDAYCDLRYQPEFNSNFQFKSIQEEDSMHLCEWDDETIVYYEIASKLPQVVKDLDTLETEMVSNPYGNAQVNAVYLISRNAEPKILYFVMTPEFGWKLLYIDDSRCSA